MSKEPSSKRLKTSVGSLSPSDDDDLIAELAPETLLDAAPFEIVEYIRQFTGPEPVYEVSYSVNIPRANEAENRLFEKNGVNIFEPMYFTNEADSKRAKKYIRANHEYFGVKLNKFLTRAGANNAIVINGEPHLIFKMQNLFNSYQDFAERVITPLEKIKRIRASNCDESSSSSAEDDDFDEFEEEVSVPVAGKSPAPPPIARMAPVTSQTQFHMDFEEESQRYSVPQTVQAVNTHGGPPSESPWWVWDFAQGMWLYKPPF